jgi:hypothetical protein
MATDNTYSKVSHQPMLQPMALAALWRHRAAKELRLWQKWLSDEQLLDKPGLDVLSHAQDQLTKMRYTIAVVAEVSRGKSEFINATLFAQHGKRIVPSGAGRTTMCPTEFFCDEDQAICLELLPIETREHTQSLQALSNTASAWERIDLSNADSDEIARALQRVSHVKKVSKAQAAALGFAEEGFNLVDDANNWVEIPAWRYARMNLHHPLLAAGLAILDTPGLNVLGCETELTYAILPSVDAVIYMLSADVGVTRSDQHAWQQYLGHLPEHSKMIVLNKIDTLHDGIRSPLEVQTDILQQIDRCATALNTPKSQVHAISARSALSGRMAQDDAQLKQSRLPLFESSLTTQLLEKRQSLLKKHALDALEQSYRASARFLRDLISQSDTQLQELDALSNTSNPQQALDAYDSDTKKRFTLEAALTKNISQTMGMHASRLLEVLSATSIQNLFETAINSCKDATPNTIKLELQTALLAVQNRIEQAQNEAQNPLTSAKNALKKVHRLNGSELAISNVDVMEPLSFTLILEELTRIIQTSAAQLPSLPIMTASQRSKASHTMMAIRLRCVQLGVDASSLCGQWLSTLSEPINHALVLHQALLLKRTDTLSRMQQAQQALTQNLDDLREAQAVRQQQLARLKHRCEQASWAIAGNADSQLT